MTVCLSLLLIFFALSGKDRVFYILCGGWLAYFVLGQLFSLPETISVLVNHNSGLGFGDLNPLTTNINVALSILSMVCIVAIGGLLVEYMNDGTIYNKAFVILCVASILMQTVYAIVGIYDIASGGPTYLILSVFHMLSRICMVFLFAYFAYDSAKVQLSKTQL